MPIKKKTAKDKYNSNTTAKKVRGKKSRLAFRKKIQGYLEAYKKEREERKQKKKHWETSRADENKRGDEKKKERNNTTIQK